MKKLLISALALTVSFGAMAQSKEELKAIKEQQKVIATILKDAEKLSKVAEDAMGQVDQSKTPDFAGAQAKIAEALANPQAKTMLGDINRVAADIEYNVMRFNTAGAGAGDQTALKSYLDACGAGYKYYQAAWDAYAVPDEKGKVNTKFNDKMAANAANLFLFSSGLYNSGLICFQAEEWEKAAEYWTLAGDAVESPMIAAATAKNPLLAANIEEFKNDSARFQSKLYAASCYNKVDHNKCIEAYKNLLKENRQLEAVYSGIISEYAELKDTTNMINWLNEGIKALPGYSVFTNSLFYIYLDRQDYDGAIASLKKSLESTPDNVGAMVLIARLYTQQGKHSDAAPYYQKAISLDAENLDANLYYGLNYLAEMEAGESEMLKNHAREAEMDKFSNEKLDAALPYLRKAYQLDSNHENNDIPTLLMQVLYRKFQPSNAQNKAALIQEYNEVADAYGRPQYNR